MLHFTIPFGKEPKYLEYYFPKDNNGVNYGFIRVPDDDNYYLTKEYIFSPRMIPYLINAYRRNMQDIPEEVLNAAKQFNYKIEIDTSSPKLGNGELRPKQYELIKKLTSKSGGIFQAPTGFGKNVVITYLVTHYTGEGNILIIAPTLSILDEIKQRAVMFGVDFPVGKCMAIHAGGFMNSNYKDSEFWKDWMSKVDLVIVDEAENVSPSMGNIFNNFCPNYRFIYGFSATPDKYSGKDLTWSYLCSNNCIPMLSLHPETVNLLYYFGQASVVEHSDKKFSVLKVKDSLPVEPKPKYQGDQQAVNKAIDSVLTSESLAKLLSYVYLKYTKSERGCNFLPIKTIASGVYVFQTMSAIFPDMRIVFWSANGMICTDNIKDKGIISYETLKKAINDEQVDLLIGTSVAYRGVDFQNIVDTTLIIGCNNAIVNQTIGRSFRSTKDIRVWLLYNKNDEGLNYKNPDDARLISTPIYNAMNGSKMKQLRTSHPNNFVEVDLGDIDEILEKELEKVD